MPMEYSELIKNFETIRAYLRDFYIFGFRTRNEFTGKSARKYDNERRRAEDWLGGVMQFRTTEAGKIHFISADSRVIPQNPLYKAFKNKSFTAYDIALHFHILNALADKGEHSLRDIADRISGRWQAVPGAPDFPDDATIRNKLNEYVRLGILRSRREKRAMAYSLRPAKANLAAYLEAIAFASEALPLGVIGSFLLDSLACAPPFFSHKHRYLPGALDAEVLLALLECRSHGLCARIASRTKNSGAVKDLVFPLRFYLGTQTGRDYLLAWSLSDKKMRMYRMDRLTRVEAVPDKPPGTAREMPTPSSLESWAGDLRKRLWGVSFGKNFSDNKQGTPFLGAAPLEEMPPQRLSMTIHAGPDERHIVQRLEKEKRCGAITQLDAETWRFDAEVYDAREMLPWLRTFIGRIISLDCSDPAVTEQFHRDLEAMFALYGDAGDAV